MTVCDWVCCPFMSIIFHGRLLTDDVVSIKLKLFSMFDFEINSHFPQRLICVSYTLLEPLTFHHPAGGPYFFGFISGRQNFNN